MEKLTRQQIAALTPDDEVFVKLFRLWEPEPKLIFEGPTTLYIERFKGNMWFSPVDPDWAQYDLADIQNDGSAVVEDYLMEIYALVTPA